MTVLTKPFSDKKVLIAPNGENVSLNIGDVPSGSCETIASETMRQRRKSVWSTLFLFLSALGVLCMGIVAGLAIYRAYGRAQMNRMRFHGYCGVPYDSNAVDFNAMRNINNKWRDDFTPLGAFSKFIDDNSDDDSDNDINEVFFKEEVEINMNDDDAYTKIYVPDFRDGRNGRFLHDFKDNQSVIIDVDEQRCFVMPLDRETVMVPRDLVDLITKMWSGYYNIDTQVIKKNMRVVTPAVTDMSTISPRIQSTCEDMKIYRLEKFVSGVFKRDIHSSGKYAEFAGNKIKEFNIVNIHELNQ